MAAAISAAVHKTEPPLRYLTKSLVRTALKCPQKVVYATNKSVYPLSKDHLNDPLLRHLSQEGERFGEYCKRLFPHGVEIGKDDVSAINNATSKRQSDATLSLSTSSLALEHLATETHQLLMGEKANNERVTLFEGSVHHDYFYVQPDILDKIVKPESNQIELRVIEVKSKSWDSRHTVESKMWNQKQKSIKSLFLPYIQDVAFQSMVCRLAYPDFHISSWLMMPDRAKTMHHNPGHHSLNEDSGLSEKILPTDDETVQAIDGSIATLINVDEYVEVALSSEVAYPGSMKGETFKNAAQRWAERLNSGDLDSFATPIGMQCSSCEYRLNKPSEGTYSGFHNCWQNATGINAGELQNNPLVVDLYGNIKRTMDVFLSGKKTMLREISASDLGLNEDGTHLEDDTGKKKKKMSADTITKSQRQWYHVQANKNSAKDGSQSHPRHIIKRKHLEQAMKSWKYPLQFIDFETISPAVPYYQNMSPYETFSFQFSHHIMDKNCDGSLEVHHATEFLHTGQDHPSVPFLRALLNAIGNNVTDVGTVFQWSPHETHVLQAMLSSQEVISSLTSREMSALSAIRDNGMVDLCKLARKYYYVDGSGCSSSIKRLLQPTINVSGHLKKIYGSPTYNGKNFSNMQWYQLDDSGGAIDPYDILSDLGQHDSATISEGGAAAAAFSVLQNNPELGEQERKAIENSLLRYCELDTLAMVMIVQAWQGFLDDEAQKEC